MKKRYGWCLWKFLMFGTVFSVVLSCSKDEENLPENSVNDVEGKVYQTVVIGTQTWMAENLQTSRLNDGTPIPRVEDDSAWFNSRALMEPAYCWYDNDGSTYEAYGVLYNWYTVNTDKLCPTGWHVPSDDEWTELTTFLGGEKVAGGLLKEAGTDHWFAPNTAANNETGFTALPAGYRLPDGYYDLLGLVGFWWSTDSVSNEFNDFGIIRWLANQHGQTNWDGLAMNMGASVRCLKD